MYDTVVGLLAWMLTCQAETGRARVGLGSVSGSSFAPSSSRELSFQKLQLCSTDLERPSPWVRR